MTSFTETDPVFQASAAAGITAGNISNWNTAYGWGDHSAAGYLTSVTSINDIGDVNITSLTSGSYLKYNGFAWINTVDIDDGNF